MENNMKSFVLSGKARDVFEKVNEMSRLPSTETPKVVNEILEKFCKWADERISTLSYFPESDRHTSEQSILQFAKKNLVRIIKEVMEVK